MTRAPEHMSPEHDRREREQLVARAVSEGLAECAQADTWIAAQLSAKRSHVARWRDPGSGQSIPGAQILGLPPLARRRVIEVLAISLGCALAELPAASSVGNDLALAIALQRETSEAVSSLLAAIADGAITRIEATPARREVRGAIAALLAVDAVLASAEREGVVAATGLPLRSVGGGR